MSDYVPINPNDFAVKDAISHLNNNIDYLYSISKTEPGKVTKVNLIPYSDFSIASNLAYWKPLEESVLTIKDNQLCANSATNLVGVITPIIKTTLKKDETYTLLINARTTSINALFNELYFGDKLQILNDDKYISQSGATYHTIYFKPLEDMTNIRLTIGSGDPNHNDEDNYIYINNIPNNSPTIPDDNGDINNVLPDSFNIAIGDDPSDDVCFTNTLYYMLSTNDLTYLNNIMRYFSNDEIPSSADGTKYSLLETFLLDLLKVKLELQGVSRFQGAHEPIFDYLGSLYNNSDWEGLIPVLRGNKEYSLLLSLYAIDIIDLWLENKGNYVGFTYDLETIRIKLISFVEDNYSQIYSNKLIKGAIQSDTTLRYGYLNEFNRYSDTKVSLLYQVELMRLFIKAGKISDIETICRNLLDYKQKNIDCAIPNVIKINGNPALNTEISITVAANIINIINMCPEAFSDPIGLQKAIATQINALKCVNGLYKYNYTVDEDVYSSNQYTDTNMDGLQYVITRDLYFPNIGLYEGEVLPGYITDDMEASIKDLYSRVEDITKVSDIVIDEDQILAIVGTKYVAKEFLNGELSLLEERVNQAELLLREDSIIATVTRSDEWLKMNDTIETNNANLLQKINEAGAQISLNTNAITSKVWTKDIVESLNSVTTIGPNIVRNSSFLINNYKYWTLSSTDGVGVVTDGASKTWFRVAKGGTIVQLSQECTTLLPTGMCNLSFDAYGNGAIQVIIENASNILVDEFIETSISENRYSYSFENPWTNATTVQFILTCNSEIYLTHIKICVGSYDYGWSMHNQDFDDMNTSLYDDFYNLSEYIDTAFRDGVLTDAEKSMLLVRLQSFLTEKNQWASIYTEINGHKALEDSDLIVSLAEKYNLFLEKANNITSYIVDATEKGTFTLEGYTNLATAYSEVLDEFVKLIQQANNLIALYEADTASNSIKDLIDRDIEEVNSAMGDLSDYVTGAFKDGILDEQEKIGLKVQLNLFEKEYEDIKGSVDYYNEIIENKEEPLLVNLNTVFSEYDEVIDKILAQVNLMLDSTRITQDMSYVLNGYILEGIQASANMNKALTEIADKYSHLKINTAVANIQIDIDKLSTSIEYFTKDLEGIVDDGILTTLEKNKVQAKFEALKDDKIQVDVEVDYYITHPLLIGTTEITNLQSKYSIFSSDFISLQNELDDIMAMSVVSSQILNDWNSLITQFNTSMEALVLAIKNAAQKLMLLSSESVNKDILDAINNLEESFDGILNITDEIFEDNIISYIEIAGYNNQLENLKNDHVKLIAEVDELLIHDAIVDTDIATLLLGARAAYINSYDGLVNAMNSIISDLKVTDDERINYDLATSTYRIALSDLQVAMIKANNQIISNIFVENGSGVTTEYVNIKVQEVQDALDKVKDLSDDAFLDSIINASERTSFKTIKDILYKEHLDVMKQLEVYLDAALTPELVGHEILLRLNNSYSDLSAAYTSLENELNNIISANVISNIDKTNYNNATTNYSTVLEEVRKVLTEATLIATNKDLQNFITGEYHSLVERVTNAEEIITEDNILHIVESNTTTLVTKEQFNGLKEEYESTKDVVSSHNVALDSVTTKVEAAELNITTINGTVQSLTTRVSEAEHKVSEDSIIATVTKEVYTKEDVDGKTQELKDDFNTAIQQTADSISLSVSQLQEDLDENYPTKAEVDSAIEQSASSITSTVNSNFATKGDVQSLNDTVWLNYAQKSEVQQTAQAIKFSFLSSGGYNKLRNSAFKNGTTNWNYLSWNGFAGNNGIAYGGMHVVGAGTSEWGLHNRNVLCIYADNLQVANGDLLGVGVASDPIWGGVNWTFSCLLSSHRTNQIYLEVIEFDSNGNRMPLQNTLVLNGDKNGWNSNRENWHKVNWKFDLKNSGCANFVINIWMGAWNGEQTSAFLWVAEPMVVLGHYDELLYTENSDELYSGVTTIDSSGIKVTSSQMNGYTHMTDRGFFINHNGTDVFRVDPNGLYMNGSGTFTGTVSASTVDGGTVKGATIQGGSININNKFEVNTSGSVTTRSTINALGGLYTGQDIRGYDPTGVSGGLTLVTGTGHLAVRTENANQSVYLQSASGEVKVTAPKDPNTFSNLRAWSLLANNAVYANGIMLTSDINKKKNIEDYTEDALHEICTTPIRQYHLKDDLDEEIKRIGIILQEAPLNAIDIGGTGVDLYQMVTMSWKAIQELKEENDKLQQRVAELEEQYKEK